MICQKMKRLKSVITLFLFSLFLWGCSSLYMGSKICQIQPGMSTEQVTKLLGEPTHRRFDNRGEEWEYKWMDSPDYHRFIIINYVDGRVVAMNTFDKDIIKPPVFETPPVIIPSASIYPHDCTKQVINDRELNLLCKKINEEPFDDKKMEIVEIGTTNSYFTCMHCRKIMSLFTFDEEKIQVLRLMSRKIIDRQNVEQIADCFPFDSEKETVRKIVCYR